MKNIWLALSLALLTLPVAALADDNAGPTAPAPPAMTPAQREAMHKTFEGFMQQEAQLHRQMRTQILAALTPAHRSAVAGVLGELAISETPDAAAAAKQLDAVLSPAEQQRILSAHTDFATRSHALHEQMRTQLQSEMPARPQGAPMHGPMGGDMGMSHPGMPNQSDAGAVLLAILSHPGMMEMVMSHHMEMTPAAQPPR